MAEVIKKFFGWKASESPDVEKYVVYVSEPGGNATLASMSWEFDKDTTEVTIPDDLPGFPQVEAVYELAVMSVDDVGNKSDMAVISAPFDFDAPLPPTELYIRDAS